MPDRLLVSLWSFCGYFEYGVFSLSYEDRCFDVFHVLQEESVKWANMLDFSATFFLTTFSSFLRGLCALCGA